MSKLSDEQKEQLYHALVALCQGYGFTTEHTYAALHSAVDSIILDAPSYELEGA